MEVVDPGGNVGTGVLCGGGTLTGSELGQLVWWSGSQIFIDNGCQLLNAHFQV